MRRLALAVGVAVLGAVAFAAWSLAAPTGSTREQSQAGPARLPGLPAEVRARGRWRIGVKCDFPPFGYINRRNQNAGYDVDVARRFAALGFGRANRVSLTCTTTPSRIPTLTSGRVDIIISTLTWTAAREEVIDYSLPYYGATGRLLVRNNVRLARSIRTALNGKTIITTRGSIYDRFVNNCFKNSRLLVVDSPAAATLAVKDGRADMFMFDDAFLLGVAAPDPSVRMTTHKFLAIPWGIGIRKGDRAMKRWVDAAVAQMKRNDEFFKIFKRNSPRTYHKVFATNVPRPRVNLRYPRGTVPEQNCPR